MYGDRDRPVEQLPAAAGTFNCGQHPPLTDKLDNEEPMDQKDSMEEGADGIERPGEFLANLGQALREQDGADVGLAEILSTHLLTAEPAADAVSKANAAILKLARTRAALPGSETDSG